MSTHVAARTAAASTIAPMLSVRNGARAVEFYKAAFGATEVYRVEDPGGAVVSRLSVGGGEVWVADESPEHANFTATCGSSGRPHFLVLRSSGFSFSLSSSMSWSISAKRASSARMQERATSGAMNVRAAADADIDHLARIWYDGWHEAHTHIVPAELTRLRTLESFRDRLRAALPKLRVVGPSGAPVGFCIVKDDELYQLFVTAQSRGSGVAAALVADAEARLAAGGHKTAWLACAIGNERAARFYEKCGWRRTGTMLNHAETSNGTFPLEVWRYEKSLTPPA